MIFDLTLIVSPLSYDCLCTVSLPRGAMDWSVFCDCGIQ